VAFVGFAAGYVAYDMTHYYLHHFHPRSAYIKRLKRHHMDHHFKDHSRLFGVSSRLWDFVFRTQ
jgi:sterol desaturase/sphingolipid hydroxylase (fatty acid hydroxylase superfamily)